jgi:hypothetical protein
MTPEERIEALIEMAKEADASPGAMERIKKLGPFKASEAVDTPAKLDKLIEEWRKSK